MFKIFQTCVAVLSLAACGRVCAQDYWLVADPAVTAAGETGDVRLYAGHGLEGHQEKSYQAQRVERFEDDRGTERRDLAPLAVEGATPFVHIAYANPGTHVVALDRRPVLTEITGADFNRYLGRAGLDSVLQQRQTADEYERPARERYRRYAKAYVQVGPELDLGNTGQTGQKLEIAPSINPLAMKPGQLLPVQIRFEGKPLPKALLTAFARMPGGKIISQQVATDANGDATIDLHTAGFWLLRIEHMQRAAINDETADWDSYWATCTFTIP